MNLKKVWNVYSELNITDKLSNEENGWAVSLSCIFSGDGRYIQNIK